MAMLLDHVERARRGDGAPAELALDPAEARRT
jgi:hypothetical protein